jgi:hypothetical protein
VTLSYDTALEFLRSPSAHSHGHICKQIAPTVMASKACGCAEMSSYGAASFDEKHAVFRPPPNQNGIRCRIMLAMLSASAAALVIVGLHFTPTSVPEKEDSTSSVQLTTLATYASNPKYPSMWPWMQALTAAMFSQTCIHSCWPQGKLVSVVGRVPPD